NRTRITWDAIASGAYIVTTRRAYDAVGTHEAVRGAIAEDVELAQAYVRHRLDIFLTHAAQFMSVRMYRNLVEIVEGWSKNLALGVPLMFPPLPFVRRVAPYLMWLPALCWVLPPLLWAVYGWSWAAATTLVSLAIWVAVYRAEGAPVRYASVVSARGRHGGVYHDQVSVQREQESRMAGEDLHAAGLKNRRVIPALQQIVQHLVLGDLTVVQLALRHVNGVRRAPPTVAPALVGGTRVARPRHRVPLHAIEVTP